MSVKPYGSVHTKRDEVKQMFDNIAPTYDLLNHALSFNIDRIWRKKVISLLKTKQPRTILDVATGTGDLAIAARKLHPEKIVGIDLSLGMIEIGRKKVDKKGLSSIIELIEGDSEDLPFEENTFDAVTVAFGVRNFENPLKGMEEMYRVTRSGGNIIVLEFMLPESWIIRPLYLFYFRRVLPSIGRLISKDFSAYKYLPDSVSAFPQRQAFLDLMVKAGYKMAGFHNLTAGVAGIYFASK
ncbi:MAG: bifunctional demethylmenaquinone methyltransferase/2-methoxy-6-polyprenyl-1,4-benzoquinol methylase UbiE [Bacteroidales bacterium]|nr:bifunctional demethylmenaquinone methyltransferase/2-methoxy-6-polyprenyl-1,4-benzoquinol methylase UbiE [Bacteroidales bacterium]